MRGAPRKLDAAQVATIRKLYPKVSAELLARRYGVSTPTIYQVLKRAGTYRD